MFQKFSKTIKNIKRILRLTILSIFVNFRRFLTNFDEHECKNIKFLNKIRLIDFDVFEKSISNLSMFVLTRETFSKNLQIILENLHSNEFFKYDFFKNE